MERKDKNLKVKLYSLFLITDSNSSKIASSNFCFDTQLVLVVEGSQTSIQKCKHFSIFGTVPLSPIDHSLVTLLELAQFQNFLHLFDARLGKVRLGLT